MADPENESQKRFVAIALALTQPVVKCSETDGTKFSSSVLRVHDKIFAMLSGRGRFVVKLPRSRVDAPVNAGAGERFDVRSDGPLREWLEMKSGSVEQWLGLAEEALEFVGN